MEHDGRRGSEGYRGQHLALDANIIDTALRPLVEALAGTQAALDAAQTMIGQRFTREVRDACPEWYEVTTTAAKANDIARAALKAAGD